VKLNLGCGAHIPDGWVNVDYALGARFVKLPFFSQVNKKLKLFDMNWGKSIYLHDLTKKFPWADSSIDVIYSSHTLEHFSKEEGRKFLGECYRVLRKDGIIRIVVPDLMHNVTEYVEGRIRADDFLELLGVLYGDSGGSEMKKKLAPFYKYPHKCMYDTPRLVTILDEIGFQASSRGAFDSDIEGISTIELEERTDNSVIAEGRKA